MATAATFYFQANKTILQKLPRELAFSKQGKSGGQELNLSWEIRAKASEWYYIRLGQHSLWLQEQQCICVSFEINVDHMEEKASEVVLGPI